MKNQQKPKTDPLGWLKAIFFPKKSQPLTHTSEKEPAWMPKNTNGATSAASEPLTQPGTDTLQVVHTVSAPEATPKISVGTAPAPAPQPQVQPQAKPEVKAEAKAQAQKPIFQPAKLPNAFWTVASVFSLIVNLILIVVLVIVARQLFALKAIVGDKLLGGLYENFIYMDQAHIQTNITVEDSIPINFTLPISTDTVVVLNQNTPINGANVRITSGGLTINSPANIVLPAGTSLPVHLQLEVPVSVEVPIKLNVPVDIPLENTELHKPFIGLQQVVAPFYQMLGPNIEKPTDLESCKSIGWLCNWFFYTP
jgi:hypothetical protein